MAEPTDRRSFLRSGGAGLGALLGAAAVAQDAAAATSDQDLQQLRRELEMLQSREQILALRQHCLAALSAQDAQWLEQFAQGEPLWLQGSCRAPAGAGAADPHIAADGTHASLSVALEVALERAIEGNSTAAQMARLQGQELADLRWQPGTLHLTLRRRNSRWQIESLRFVSDTATA